MKLEQRLATFFHEAASAGAPPPVEATTRLVVAVSGGADSLALLHLLTHSSLHPQKNIVAAHLDHALRPSSAAEAEQVAQWATGWGVSCRLGRVEVGALAAGAGLSLEAAARQARYQFLAGVAAAEGASAVLTGHTADDQAETVLMRLIRGTGVMGLGAMRPVSPLPGGPGLTLLRPLLTTSRAEILKYCRAHDLQPIEDESNADPAFFRNRIRHELLPYLATFNPQIKERLRSLAAIVAADRELLEGLAAKVWPTLRPGSGPGWLALDRPAWLELPLSQRRATLQRALAELAATGEEIGFLTLEQARQVAERGQTGAESHLPAALLLTVGYGRLYLSAGPLPLDQWPQLPAAEAYPLVVPGHLPLAAGWRLEARAVTDVGPLAITANEDPLQAFLDASAAPLTVRPRNAGERFQPLGMAGASAALKEVMINRKIPAAARPLWPIVATPDHLAWLAGHTLDERVRVMPATSQLIHLRLHPPGWR
jgi:tRNA(Ile)-lysidine synthase